MGNGPLWQTAGVAVLKLFPDRALLGIEATWVLEAEYECEYRDQEDESEEDADGDADSFVTVHGFNSVICFWVVGSRAW